ncbi:hypothetical protein, partial [Corynebacterium mastitidis]|uniref:hypothetical protein n=1 Tax=Corynebacterium mastitidis TaxID=161890 RepID=UPI001F19C23A
RARPGRGDAPSAAGAPGSRSGRGRAHTPRFLRPWHCGSCAERAHPTDPGDRHSATPGGRASPD